MTTPDPRIAKYIAQIEQPGIPYVSSSHYTLHELGRVYGHELIASLVKDYFERKRNAPTD